MKKRIHKLVTIDGKPKYLTLEVELELNPTDHDAISYVDGSNIGRPLRFSASCWFKCGDTEMGGQAFDTVSAWLYKHDLDCPILASILPMWKKWHLSDMTAGSKRQEEAISEWKRANKYEYGAACEYLKKRHLYTDSKCVIDGKGYEYGSRWLARIIPDADVKFIRKIMDDMPLEIRHIEK